MDLHASTHKGSADDGKRGYRYRRIPAAGGPFRGTLRSGAKPGRRCGGGGAPDWTGTLVGGFQKGVLFRIVFRVAFSISFWTDFERFWEFIFDDFQRLVATHFRRRNCIAFPSDFDVFFCHF